VAVEEPLRRLVHNRAAGPALLAQAREDAIDEIAQACRQVRARVKLALPKHQGRRMSLGYGPRTWRLITEAAPGWAEALRARCLFSPHAGVGQSWGCDARSSTLLADMYRLRAAPHATAQIVLQ